MDNSTSGRRTTTRRTSRTCTSAPARGDESLKKYYEKQSSGRYSVDGAGHRLGQGHVQRGPLRPRPTAYPCGQQRLQQHLGPGPRRRQPPGSPTRRPPAAPTRRSRPTWRQFDQWDRYDFDGDGNFNEPDGYIDHFQIVHAGGDQADGDPVQGEDAIWSHRWYAFRTDQRPARPTTRLGGTQIGDTGIWVGDYTMQPENGGLGVFAHEYGHDLGLPDLLRHRRRRQQRSLDPDGAEPARRQERPASAPAPATSAPGTSCSSAGSTTRSSRPADARTAGARPAGVQLRQEAAGRRRGAAGQARVTIQIRRAVRGQPSSGGRGNGDDLNTTMTRTIDLTGKTSAPRCRSRVATNIERTTTTCYVRGVLRDGGARTGLDGHRRQRHGKAPTRVNGIDGAAGTWTSADVRPVGLRRHADRAARAATSTDGARPGRRWAPRRLLRRRHHRHRGRQTVLSDGAETGAERLDPRRVLRRRRRPCTTTVRQLLHRRQPRRTCRTTST